MKLCTSVSMMDTFGFISLPIYIIKMYSLRHYIMMCLYKKRNRIYNIIMCMFESNIKIPLEEFT